MYREIVGPLHEVQPCSASFEMLQKAMGEGGRKPPRKASLVAKNGLEKCFECCTGGELLWQSHTVNVRTQGCEICVVHSKRSSAPSAQQPHITLPPYFNSSITAVIFLNGRNLVIWYFWGGRAHILCHLLVLCPLPYPAADIFIWQGLLHVNTEK